VKTAKLSGTTLAYLEEGQGPLVVLWHGFPDSAHTWDAARAALAKAGFHAVSPFLRGYHPSTLAADGRYDIETLAADVAELVNALGAHRAIIVGHEAVG
jgi:pimeloyl-ACP methyl ester carboxylesterase